MKTTFLLVLLLAGLVLLAGCTSNNPTPSAPSAPGSAPIVSSPSAPAPSTPSSIATPPSTPTPAQPSAPSAQAPPSAVSNSTTQNPSGNSVLPPANVANVKEINITAKQFSFLPNSITVPINTRVRIHLKSVDVQHGFGISEYGINEVVPAGGEKTIEFTANKAGSFNFICTVYCGAGHGAMRGTLTVMAGG